MKSQNIGTAFFLQVILYLLGASFCIYLLSLGFTDSDAGRFCQIFGTDCAEVARSEYGSFFGFSTASLGLAYYVQQLFLFMGFLWVGREQRLPLGGLILFFHVVAALASLYFLAVLILVLQQGCAACLGVHLVNFLVLVLSLQWYGRCRGEARQRSQPVSGRQGMVFAFWLVSLQFAAIVFLGVGLAASHHQLAAELEKTSKNLQYLKYLYNNATYHHFEIEEGDTMVGEQAIADHQVVIVYKDGCKHCEKAKETLTELAKKHITSFYVVMKNERVVGKERLKEWGVKKVPSVFIDGRPAEGWDVPGFLDDMKEKCGC